MTKPHITVIENMKEYKNKSVTIAARSILNLCKEINPTLLGLNEDEGEKQAVYGQSKIVHGIEGIELLKKYEHIPADVKYEYETILDNKQLKQIKLLKMKYAAEKIQHIKIKHNDDQMKEILGDKVEKKKKKYAEDNLTEEEKKLLEGYEKEENDEEEGNESDEEIEGLDDLEELPDLAEGEEVEEIEDDEENDPEEMKAVEADECSLSENAMKSNASDSDQDSANVHGFVDPGELLTYKQRYSEKREKLKNEEKEEYKHERKKVKGGGTTNKEKLKNKPMMMVIPKKRRENLMKIMSLSKKMKKIKQHLGRFKRGNMLLKKKTNPQKPKS